MFINLQASLFDIQDSLRDVVGVISALGNKMEMLQPPPLKDVIDAISTLGDRMEAIKPPPSIVESTQIAIINQYTNEIDKLDESVKQLEASPGGRFKNWAKDTFSELTNLSTNPIDLGTELIKFSGKKAMAFDAGMAQINLTARLDESGRKELGGDLQQIARANRVDIGIIPEGFDKILAEVGSVEASLPILDAALKGSKAGFLDLDSVGGALAKTMSVVGKEATAMEVMDTLFASQRLGGAQFAEVAQYIPELIAGAGKLGIKYQEVAGIFTYMTQSGESAEQASALMESLFSTLGNSDIQNQLSLAGINVLDNEGNIKSTIDLFTELQGVMGSMNNEQRTSILSAMGIDESTASSLGAMIGDVDMLKNTVDQITTATGETEKAMAATDNATRSVNEVFGLFNTIGGQIGEILLPFINVGAIVLGTVLDWVSGLVGSITSLFSWWFDKLGEGNPIVWGLTAMLAALALGLFVYDTITQKATISTANKTLIDTIAKGATTAWTTAQKALNVAFNMSPIGKIALIVGVLVTAITWAWQKFEGFRQVVYSVWEVMKLFGEILFNTIVGAIKNIIGGLGSLGTALFKLFKGDFKGAAEEAVNGAKQLFAGSPIGIAVDLVGNFKNADFQGALDKGKQKGSESFAKSQEKKDGEVITEGEIVDGTPDTNNKGTIIPGLEATETYNELMKNLGSGNNLSDVPGLNLNENQKLGLNNNKAPKVPKAQNNVPDSNINSTAIQTEEEGDTTEKEPIKNLQSTSTYSAVVKTLKPIPLATAAPVTSPTTGILSGSPLELQTASGVTSPATDNEEYDKSSTNFLENICMHVARIAAMLAMPMAVAAQPSGTINLSQLAAPIASVASMAPLNGILSTPTAFLPDNAPETIQPVMNSFDAMVNGTSDGSGAGIFAPPSGERRATVEKICDQIIINVQRGDQSEAEGIADRIMEEIRKAIDNEA